jgi:hypothetical protein
VINSYCRAYRLPDETIITITFNDQKNFIIEGIHPDFPQKGYTDSLGRLKIFPNHSLKKRVNKMRARLQKIAKDIILLAENHLDKAPNTYYKGVAIKKWQETKNPVEFLEKACYPLIKTGFPKEKIIKFKKAQKRYKTLASSVLTPIEGGKGVFVRFKTGRLPEKAKEIPLDQGGFDIIKKYEELRQTI